MISNILNTVFTRIILAFLSVLLLILNSNYLGSEGLGSVGLIVLEISVFLLFTNVICGGSMIYFAPRKAISELLLGAYLWLMICGIIAYFLLYIFPLFNSDYTYDILILGLIQSASATHASILAGKEKIKFFNAINLIQVGIQFCSLLLFYIVYDLPTVTSFIYSLYLAYLLAFIIGFIGVLTQFERVYKKPNFQSMKEFAYYGFYLQLSNIAQLFNYRLSYFILNYFTGKAAVGKFVAAVQLSEGLLLPSKSIATVQYAKIVNLKRKKKAANLSLVLLKLTLVITLPLIVILSVIPGDVYTYILGKEFNHTPQIILFMAIGILGLSGEIILSRYFSGTGQQKYNVFSTLIGLVITLSFGFVLIPMFGFIGAAITSTLSFSGMFIYMLFMLLNLSHLRIKDFLFKAEDWRYFMRIFRFIRFHQSKQIRQ